MPLLVGRLRSVASCVLISTAAAACFTGESPTDALDTETSLYAVVRTIDGVAFLPPLGPAVDAPATFDATLLDGLVIVLESTGRSGDLRTDATFDRRSTPALRLVAEHST